MRPASPIPTNPLYYIKVSLGALYAIRAIPTMQEAVTIRESKIMPGGAKWSKGRRAKPMFAWNKVHEASL